MPNTYLKLDGRVVYDTNQTIIMKTELSKNNIELVNLSLDLMEKGWKNMERKERFRLITVSILTSSFLISTLYDHLDHMQELRLLRKNCNKSKSKD